jgi:pimeloyl-ACP methyl ester carboxylesterase
MKRNAFFIILSVLLLATMSAHAQRQLSQLEGSWAGKIELSGTSFRMIFNLTMTEADTLKATADSPDQGAKDIPLGRVTLAGDTLTIAAPILQGKYHGVFTSDSTITGTWTQMGRDFPVDLKKGAPPVVYNRPQEPKPPYPYREEQVVFRNNTENFDLAGTLTLPEGNGPFPAAVLITGSGQQDRDETVFGHKPFLVISDYLTRNGIAVLRYDDRGIGGSKGNLNNVTSQNFAGDAAAAVSYLATRPEIDPGKIGLIGHSEGGLIAPIVASENPAIAFIVSLAGPGVRGKELLMKQSADILKVSGTPEKEIEEAMSTNNKLYDMVIADPDQRSFAKKALEWYGRELDAKGLTPEKRKEDMAGFAQAIVQLNNAWMRYFIATDPAIFWSKVKCPVLALNGEKDLQVNYEQNLPAIKAALKKGGNRKVKTIALPGLNHLFQHSATGNPSEYLNIEETFSPEALKIMADWIKKTMKVK